MNELNNKTEMDAEELTLAPETELFEEAKRIAEESAQKVTASFFVEYDTNREKDILALISKMGSAVEGEEEGTGALILSLNEDQLAFVKTLDYVERLRENRPMVRQVEEADETLNIEAKSILTNQKENGILNSVAPMSLEADGGVGMASEVATASVTSTCPESNTMATAIPLTIGTVKYGCICCPGAEQWYKFTVNESSTYTISTNKFTENYNLDTVGYLYDSCGNLLAQNDDHNLRLYFKIQADLEEGQTYYVKVMAYGDHTGAYSVKVENKIWVTSIMLTPSSATLEVGETLATSRVLYPLEANERRVFWISDNNNIATVNDIGVISAVGVGTTTIRVYDWDERSLGAQCTVRVGPRTWGWPEYPKPTINPRIAWNARNVVENRLKARERNPERIIFHHAAKKFSSTNISDIKAEIRRIQDLQMDDKDYPKSDIAYHFVIDPAGGIWQGAEIDGYKRGHADGYFDDIGVVLLGNFQPEFENFLMPNILNEYQKNAMKELSKWLCYEYDLKSDTTDGISPITTHRTVCDTRCPGKNAAPWIENDLKNYINAWYGE